MISNKIIFICGHRKCGTTMFGNLFDNHKDLVVYPTDLSIFYGYFPKFNNNKYTLKEKLRRLEIVILKILKEFLLKMNLI